MGLYVIGYSINCSKEFETSCMNDLLTKSVGVMNITTEPGVIDPI